MSVAVPKRKKTKTGLSHQDARDPGVAFVVRDENGHLINSVSGLRVDEENIPYINQTERKTKCIRLRTPEEARMVKERIEQVRLLLTLSKSTGDILDALSAKWNVSRETVKDYVAIARAKQQECINRKPEECFGDSLSYWTMKLEQAFTRYKLGFDELRAAREAMKLADEQYAIAIRDNDAAGITSATRFIQSTQKRISTAQIMIRTASNAADSYQDRIDRLCGNLAPERIALVTSQGQDVLKPIMEPLTREQAAHNLIDALRIQYPHLTDDKLAELGLPLPKGVQALLHQPAVDAPPLSAAEAAHHLMKPPDSNGNGHAPSQKAAGFDGLAGIPVEIVRED